MCSTPCCAACGAAGRRSRSASRSPTCARRTTASRSPRRSALLAAPRVILTTGGQSYPGSGTSGDGYAFGEPVRPHDRPAAAGPGADRPSVRTGSPSCAASRSRDVDVAVLEGEQTLLARRGGFLFAHFGLSGPVALDVSRAVSGHPDPRSLELELDFLPRVPEPEFDEFLRTESLASGKKQLAVVLERPPAATAVRHAARR